MITLTVIGVTFMLVFLQSNGGLKVERASEFSYNGHVYFNGRDQSVPALFSKSSSSMGVELPFVCTLSQLGVRVEWKDSSNAILEHDGQAYLLDINTKSLVPKKKRR